MTTRFGPTGKFPRGKISADDEGELTFGIAADHAAGVVRVAFGKPVAWLALEPDVAFKIAMSIMDKARELQRQ